MVTVKAMIVEMDIIVGPGNWKLDPVLLPKRSTEPGVPQRGDLLKVTI